MPEPLKLYNCTVEKDWIDVGYNDHMAEASFLIAFGWASDALFQYIGIDDAYRAAGHSIYAVETHINYYKEAAVEEPLTFTTQLLGLDQKRLHIFHTMLHGSSGHLLATTEQMLLHVDTKTASVAPILPEVYSALEEIMAVHKDIPIPEQVGRQIKISRNR